MRRDLLDYELPPELVASRPLPERDGARLLVVDPLAGSLSHAAIADLDALLPAGALLVVNDTRVIPARLLGHKDSGGRVEIFLVRRLGDAAWEEGGQPVPAERWEALGRSSKPLREGARITFDRAPSTGTATRSLAARIDDRGGDGGVLTVTVSSPDGGPVADAIEAFGHIPLPPYVRRGDEPEDRERYQTVFARASGAVAAPTAGLHLSTALLSRLRARGVEIASITLHVGLGTFQPVTADDLDDHPMHAERFEISPEAADAIDRARARGAPVVAVGTTVVRALESAAREGGRVRATAGETRMLIQPGYRFQVVDRLLTNFHLPQSTLLALVAAFAGQAFILAAYRAAVLSRYRFFSYGDAMLITARALPGAAEPAS